MSTFKQSIIQSFKGASKTFQTFPVAIVSAALFAIVTVIRINMDWSDQIDYNFLFNCLHLSFATSAAFGLMGITAVRSRLNTKQSFLIVNIVGAVVALITFIMLYFFGGSDQGLVKGITMNASNLSIARVMGIISVSIILFVYFAGYPKNTSNFSKSLFMTFKAFVIASLYGFVIMSGTSGVAGATESLLFENMSNKVYMYLGTITGFLSFTIFVGYFPSFKKDEIDDRRDVTQNQPKFIAVLFEYIGIPIMLALTVVLLSWTGKTVITGSWPPFSQVSGIVISYVMGGILLHLLVTQINTRLGTFYKKFYPLASLVIITFGLWALINRLSDSGLKTQEYFFIIICFVGVVSAVLLLIMKEHAHPMIAFLICVMIIVSVFPFINYSALPVRMQVNRLESMLIQEGILIDGNLIPITTELDLKIRERITESVDYLTNEEGAKLPSWLEIKHGDREVFEQTFGFVQTWSQSDDYYDPRYDESMGTSLLLKNEVLDISDYDWAMYFKNYRGNINESPLVRVEGERGVYTVEWLVAEPYGIPTLKILLNDQIILEQNLDKHFTDIAEAFESGQKKYYEETFEDMTFKIETTELKILLVFNNIDIELDPREDSMYYYIDLNVLYLKEK